MSRRPSVQNQAASGSVLDFASELNAEQLEAVTSPPGSVLVIAGAGSGKTRTLTYRVAWLLHEGISAHQIMLLTFTNKASREMLDRVARLVPHDSSQLWGGTFHHVGNRILRQNAEALGFTKSFAIHDRDESAALLKVCYEDLGVKDKKFPKPDVLLELHSLSVNTQKSLEQLFQANFNYLAEFGDAIEKILRYYIEKKVKANAMDFDDLLELNLKLLRDQPQIRKRYSFQHVLVDEYQDTNLIQAELVDLFGREHGNIMAVGDDAQSIYSWRGANFANIMAFPERHPGTKVVRLETNYRSAPEILQVANHSISHNARQFEKNLHATRKSGVKPALIELFDTRQQSAFIAQRIAELSDEGVDLSEIAVLYRSHFHCIEVQMELTRRQIPFFITSGIRFFEQAHIKDVAAHLRLLVNPQDELSFRRLALLLPGIGAKTAARMWQEAQSGKVYADIKVPEKSATAWKQWAETDRQLREMDAAYNPAELIRLIVDAYYADYSRLTYTNFSNRLDDLKQLEQYALGFSETAELLAQLALMSNLEAEAPAYNPSAVRLSTVHQAKGLEFQAVFVIMLCEGLFPSSRSLENQESEEEERRLFYVAVTRAKDELYLLYPLMRATAGQGNVMLQPSRFIEELPRELCNFTQIQQPAYFRPTYGRQPMIEESGEDDPW